jgi:small GTP-binding protein
MSAPFSQVYSVMRPGQLRAFKLVLLGSSAVGKTSIASFFAGGGPPPERHIATVGAAYCPAAIPVGEATRLFDIWDTAGQERYRALVPQYLRDAHGALMVFDIAQRQSFRDLGAWLRFLAAAPSGTAVVVFGNKTDLEAARAVPFEEAQQFCRANGLSYLEGSARTGRNIALLFQTIGELCVEAETKEAVTVVAAPVERKARPCCG